MSHASKTSDVKWYLTKNTKQLNDPSFVKQANSCLFLM